MFSNFNGRVLTEPTPVEHTSGALSAMTTLVRDVAAAEAILHSAIKGYGSVTLPSPPANSLRKQSLDLLHFAKRANGNHTECKTLAELLFSVTVFAQSINIQGRASGFRAAPNLGSRALAESQLENQRLLRSGQHRFDHRTIPILLSTISSMPRVRWTTLSWPLSQTEV